MSPKKGYGRDIDLLTNTQDDASDLWAKALTQIMSVTNSVKQVFLEQM